MLQSDRGTVKCCPASFPCTVCVSVAPPPPAPSLAPRIHRLPTDPDLFANKKIKNQLTAYVSGSHPDKILNDDKKINRTRTGSLNDAMLRIPDVEITSAEYPNYDIDIFVNNIDKSLLTPNPCLDPYTPESIDSHTPNMENNSTGSQELTEISDALGENKIDKSNRFLSNRDRSVSPTQLKSRLDLLLNSEREKKPLKNAKEIPELERLNSRESCRSSGKGGGFCCLALKCYGFCRDRARKVDCSNCHTCTY